MAENARRLFGRERMSGRIMCARYTTNMVFVASCYIAWNLVLAVLRISVRSTSFKMYFPHFIVYLKLRVHVHKMYCILTIRMTICHSALKIKLQRGGAK